MQNLLHTQDVKYDPLWENFASNNPQQWPAWHYRELSATFQCKLYTCTQQGILATRGPTITHCSIFVKILVGRQCHFSLQGVIFPSPSKTKQLLSTSTTLEDNVTILSWPWVCSPTLLTASVIVPCTLSHRMVNSKQWQDVLHWSTSLQVLIQPEPWS